MNQAIKILLAGAFLLLSWETLCAQDPGYGQNDFIQIPSSTIAKGEMESNYSHPHYVRIVYLVPADSVEKPEYTIALGNAARHLQAWYREEMGIEKTFRLKNPVVEVYHTPHGGAWYKENHPENDWLTFWNNVLADGFALTGGMYNDPQNRWLFYIDAHPACGQCGGCGGSGVVVIGANDLKGLVGRPIDKICPDIIHDYGPCRYVGGMGHELGHAFGLSHPPECEPYNPGCWDRDLMMYGYTTYPDAFLNDANKFSLLYCPFMEYVPQDEMCFGLDCSDLTDTCLYEPIYELDLYYGDSVFLQGAWQSQAGVYFDTIRDDFFCDSIITSIVHMKTPPPKGEDVWLCEGDSPCLRAEGEDIRWYSYCPPTKDLLYDARDGQSYKTVIIGEQIWMAENLNYYTPEESWYYNGDSTHLADVFGRLYLWESAHDVCPEHWHLPDSTEWMSLINELGGIPVAGGNVKAEEYWKKPNTGATNSSGFSALPSGNRYSSGSYMGLTERTYFWSSSDYSETVSYSFQLSYDSEQFYRMLSVNSQAYSVRCIRDSFPLLAEGNEFYPSCTIAGDTTFYVTQTLHGQESACDTLTLHIGSLPATPTQVDAGICEGESYAFEGRLLTEEGEYQDTLSTAYGCDSVLILSLLVHPLPQPDLGPDTTIFVSDTLWLNGGEAFSQYLWDDGCETARLMIHHLEEGDYIHHITVWEENGCSQSDTIVIHVLDATSVVDHDRNPRFEVYPNPTGSNLYLRMEQTGNFLCNLEITDLFGKQLIHTKTQLSGGDHPFALDVSPWPDGVYFLHIRGDGFQFSRKIIKIGS